MSNFLEGFSSRIKNLYPYVFLANSFSNASKYKEYDILSLGFSLMLFILDSMLIGKEECSMDDMTEFINKLIRENYDEYLSDEEGKDLTYYLKDLLNNGGQVYKVKYRNLSNGKEEIVQVKLIEQVSYEIKGKVKYKLTSQGLDLIFKTREVYTEYKITVEQLYLKQQIKNGIYSQALSTVEQLNASVRKLREQIEELYLKIRRNILGVEVEELKLISKKTEEQLDRETKIFDDITTLLRNQKRNYENIEEENLSIKDLEQINNINKIEEQLIIIIEEHSSLLNDKLQIYREYVRVLENSISFGIRESIDFEKEIFDDIFLRNKKEANVISNQVLKPIFFNNSKNKIFNILGIFGQQNLRKEIEEEISINYEKELELQEKKEKELLLIKEDKLIKFTIAFLQGVLDGKSTLGEIIKGFSAELKRKISYDFDIITYLIKIHQQKIVKLDEILRFEDKFINEELKDINIEYYLSKSALKNRKIRNIKEFSLIASKEYIYFKNGNRIEDFKVRRIIHE